VGAVALAVAALHVAGTGCGIGPGGSSKGRTSLTVTRDYGAKRLLRATVSELPASETAMRMLERRARLSTRYGGRFVQSIDGISGSDSGSRRFDWFFYVNGIESSIGAADVKVHQGDRVWWDYRDWTDAMRVPAVVGSWPEPFAHGSAGRPFPVRVDCLGADSECHAVADKLSAAGVDASIGIPRARVGKNTLRVVVGPWAEVREDKAAAQLEEGPERSGVFASFRRASDGSFRLELDDARGRAGRRAGPGAGLVAAVRHEDEQPTWVVTGTDRRGLRAAITLLRGSALRDRYAVATTAGGSGPIALPLR
jgi:hypothetical protein